MCQDWIIGCRACRTDGDAGIGEVVQAELLPMLLPDHLERRPEPVEVQHVLQHQTELPPPDQPVLVHVRSAARALQGPTVLQLRPELVNSRFHLL